MATEERLGGPLQQERAVQTSQYVGLSEELRLVLSEWEFSCLAAIYIQQLSQRELAIALAGPEASQEDVLNMERQVNKGVSRAREKARERLPAKWAALAREVA